MEPLVHPEAHASAVGLEGVEHELALAGRDDVVFGAVKHPDGGAAQRAGIFAGKNGRLLPALGGVAPKDAGGGKGDGCPAARIGAGSSQPP